APRPTRTTPLSLHDALPISMDPYRYTKYCVRCDKIRPITPKRSPNSHIGTVRWVPWWLSTLPDQNSDFQPPILPTYLLGWTNDSCPSLFTPVKQTGSTRSLERSPLAGHYASDTV